MARPTAEAIFFVTLIAYYDSSFVLSDDGLSALAAKIATYFYLIYLMHFFYVFWMGQTFFLSLSNARFLFCGLGRFGCFLVAAALTSISYHFIELLIFTILSAGVHALKAGPVPDRGYPAA